MKKIDYLCFQVNKINIKKNISVKEYSNNRYFDNTVIKPVIRYGVETACFPNLDKFKKNREENFVEDFWTEVNIRRRRSNEDIYRQINDLETDMRIRRLRFYGHMERMSEKDYVKKFSVQF